LRKIAQTLTFGSLEKKPHRKAAQRVQIGKATICGRGRDALIRETLPVLTGRM
jgi:hypothetical protein